MVTFIKNTEIYQKLTEKLSKMTFFGYFQFSNLK